MTQVTALPSEVLGVQLFDREWKRFRKRTGWMKNRRRMTAARVYLESEQTFVLMRGDAPFGRTKVMTGREAVEANKRFEDQFAKTCLEHPERRLWRWKPLDGRAVREKCKQAALEVGT